MRHLYSVTPQQHLGTHRTVQQPRVQMGKPEMGSDGFGNRAFSRSGRAINRDGEGSTHALARTKSAPNAPMRPSKIGNEVAIGPPSSTDTGALAAMPKIRKDIAMR